METKRPALILAEEIIRILTARKKMIVGAESLTSGLASDFIGRIPGASKVFWGSFVTYTADAKLKMLGVPLELIREHGEVSQSVALAMAEGALAKSGAAFAFSTTGLAGPGACSTDFATENSGDSSGRPALPVGTTWIGLARQGWSGAKMFLFSGQRNEVREAAVVAALEEVLNMICLT